MRSNYKKLGPYIRQVDIRNEEGKEDNLLGVSTQKVFIESIANTVGTDFTKYKIVKRNQFTYVPDTSRRGEKIGLAMLEHLDEGLVSQVYTVFEIIDHNELDPEYLMMWFRRPEFDRYARYKSHGSVREIFGWDEMCDVELPIPSIEKQRKIVREYNTIVNHIQLNEKMNQKLEETAQAIYKHWFVDFEFPISAEYAASIGKPELEGKPHKSSGGEMVFCEELDQEIPLNWEYGRLDKIASLSAGGDKPKVFSDYQTDKCPIPIYANGTFNEGFFGFTDKAKIKDACITISARGGIGYAVLRHKPFVPIVRLIVAKPKMDNLLNYLFQTIKRFQYQEGTSSAQSQLTVPDISSYKLIRPDTCALKSYQFMTEKIYDAVQFEKALMNLFCSLLSNLNSKMSRAA